MKHKEDYDTFWKELKKWSQIRDKLISKRGWTPIEYHKDELLGSSVSKWKTPSGKIVDDSEAYDLMTSAYLEEKGWRSVIELKRIGKAEWKKPIERWGRYQSPVTKRLYTFLDAQNIMENDWDESIECSKHCTMLNNLVSNFAGTHIKTWFYIKDDEKIFCHWTIEPYMIEAGLAVVKKYDPNVAMVQLENKNWSGVPFGSVSDDDREILYANGWHEVNGTWGYEL